MTDRLTMVTELGLLAQEAAQRGDDRAAGVLRGVAGHLMEVHSDLLKLEERRRKDRERPRRTTGSTESLESAESAEKGGFPPDPLSSKKQPPQLHRAREAGLKVELVDSEGVPLVQVDEIDEATWKFARDFPVAWLSVNPFLCRRPLRTWLGWIRQMRKLLTGTKYAEEDLATTCDHDAALSRQIGSPLGLESFMNTTFLARTVARDVRPITDAKQRGNTVAQRTLDNARKAFGE